MTTSREFIVRHARPGEMLQVGVLVARVFTQGAPQLYPKAVHRSGEGLLQMPGFDSAMCRIGLVDGQIVSHVRVEPYDLRYGSAWLRVAGVASVCTHPDFRKRGYSGAVMRDALAYMAEQGMHLALLNSGIAGHYRRFGFSPVWPYYHFEVDSAEAAALENRLPLRAARADDIPALASLYDRHWGGRVAFARHPESWLWRVTGDHFQVWVVEDDHGQVCGYVAGRDPGTEEVDVVVDTPEAATAVLAEWGRRCQEVGRAQVRWALPPDDPLINFARQVLTVTVSARYRPDAGWMARLIDAQGLVEALLPEIVAQAQTIMPELEATDLIFRCQPDRVEIGLGGRKSTHSQLNHQDFIQVMFGSLHPSALAMRAQSSLHPDAVRLLEALFPPRVAALAGWDWF